jgi:hypothetical protein
LELVKCHTTGSEHLLHRGIRVQAVGVEGWEQLSESAGLRPFIVPEGRRRPVAKRHGRQPTVPRDEAFEEAPAWGVVIGVPAIVPQADPIRPGVDLSSEEFVDVLEEEAGVERGEVLESNPAVVGVPAGERPRDDEAVASGALDGTLPE